jgi:hypothetical protein
MGPEKVFAVQNREVSTKEGFTVSKNLVKSMDEKQWKNGSQ